MKTTRDFLAHMLDDDGDCPSGCDVFEGASDPTPPRELQARHFAEVFAVAQPVAQKLTDAEWQEFQAIPDQGYSHRAWVDARIAERVAVAQPEVNSVEELDALPIGSVIIDKHGDVGLIDRDGTIEKCVQFAETIAMSIGYTAKHFLPARVLYRPEVKP